MTNAKLTAISVLASAESEEDTTKTLMSLEILENSMLILN